MGHLSDPPCDDIGQNIAVPFPGVDCKKEHLVSISFGKLVPIEVAKNWLGSNPSHSQLVTEAAADSQTTEQVQLLRKPRLGSTHLPTLATSPPSGVGRGRSSYHLYL